MLKNYSKLNKAIILGWNLKKMDFCPMLFIALQEIVFLTRFVMGKF